MFQQLNSHEQCFARCMLLKILIALILVIPTVWFLQHQEGFTLPVSQVITDLWQAKLYTYGDLTHKQTRIIQDVLLFSGIGLWGALYIWGMGIVSRWTKGLNEQHHQFLWILLATAIVGCILTWVIPFHSRDIYGYINRGAQQAFYGVNPYLIPLGEMQNWQADSIFKNHWVENPCPYGFFFAWLIKWLVQLSNHQFLNAFFIIKGFNMLIHLATTALVFFISKTFKLPRPVLNAYLVGLNPLLLLHLVANGHNDGLTALLALCAMFVLIEERYGWLKWFALPVLTLSILTKYATLLLLPFIVLYLLHQRQFKTIAIGSVLALFVAFWLAWGYLPHGAEVWPTAKMSGNASISQHSLHSAVSRLAYYLSGMNETVLTVARKSLKPLFWLLFASGYFYTIWKILKQAPKSKKVHVFRPYLKTGVLWMIILLFLASSKFHAWYVGMVFPLVLCLPVSSRITQFMILLTVFQLLSFTPLENIHILNFALLTGAPIWMVLRGYQLKVR